MVFPGLEDALGAKFDTSSPEGKKKLKQTPNTFFITKGKLLAMVCMCVHVCVCVCVCVCMCTRVCVNALFDLFIIWFNHVIPQDREIKKWCLCVYFDLIVLQRLPKCELQKLFPPSNSFCLFILLSVFVLISLLFFTLLFFPLIYEAWPLEKCISDWNKKGAVDSGFNQQNFVPHFICTSNTELMWWILFVFFSSV